MVHKSTPIIPHYQYLLAITDPFWIDVRDYTHGRTINRRLPNQIILIHYQITDFHLLPPSLGSKTDDWNQV